MKKKEINITNFLIIINILFFIITLGGSIFSNKLGNNWNYTLKSLQLYRLVSCMFLHFGIMHLLCNMISLYSLGNLIENIYGKTILLESYFITGIGSSLCSAFINMIFNKNVLSGGASGAICGLMGIMLATIKGNSKNVLSNIFIAILPIIFIGFSSGVDNIAHFSGLIIGFIIGRFYVRKH